MVLKSQPSGAGARTTYIYAHQGEANVPILADLDPASATGIRIEGLAADKVGNLYTSDLDSRRFYRVNAATGAVTAVATIAPAPPTVLATATLTVPEATPTTEPEPPAVVGMPRTGQGSDMLPLTLALAAVAGALALGFVARRASRTR